MPTFKLDYVKLNESLNNLDTNYIDIYQLHSRDRGSIEDIKQTIEWLYSQKEKGVVKKLGFQQDHQKMLFFS